MSSRIPHSVNRYRLRKEIETATQAFNFSENYQSTLARFLDYTLQTHCNLYRLSDEANQSTKVSVALEAIDSGKTADLKGKCLEEWESIVKKLIEDADSSICKQS